MLRSLKSLDDFDVRGTDGAIGKVRNFYFDDERWVVRYLIVDTGGFWGKVHQVLISPAAFGKADWSTRTFNLRMSRDKVRNSPGIDLDKPVSRQFEQEYNRYYGWPTYWGSDGIWGQWTYPAELALGSVQELTPEELDGDPHLRSSGEVCGYHVQATDEEIGHVDDVIVDDETWSIRYLVVDTSNWGMGKKVLIAQPWLQGISWADRKVAITLPKDAILESPEWLPGQPVNREYEMRLYDYYGRPAYWPEEHPAPTDSQIV